MDLKEFLRMQIEGMGMGLKRATDGLTQKEIEWQPACGCNSIGLILFHIAKSEDSFIQKTLKGGAELYESGQWYTKLGLDLKEAGAHYTVDQVNAFKVPKLAKILAYQAAVRKATLAYVSKMKAADLDKVMKMPWGEMPAAMILSLVISHASQHLGEVSYLRGLQRGMDK
ncbi:MAG: DinB family protein [Dehalococcoidales bacterium]|jgi:uncharacterized damage-inducible protein DinB